MTKLLIVFTVLASVLLAAVPIAAQASEPDVAVNVLSVRQGHQGAIRVKVAASCPVGFHARAGDDSRATVYQAPYGTKARHFADELKCAGATDYFLLRFRRFEDTNKWVRPGVPFNVYVQFQVTDGSQRLFTDFVGTYTVGGAA